ncbi:class I SAM-dependent methyltransferase [Tomitella fengzijianii]|uniref:Class I SAM-dependent methyltransferase n=1 Tax=Tomitella fengzijianii TaxID=2597660 RepID=A0A516X346_9ACTN|nr:class I SAM-dependent methyltransferase [Tomitella fengzijianii]QDQ97502.1 class I SAM-dependent methyltransferase [Tomitella fengzijianii]
MTNPHGTAPDPPTTGPPNSHRQAERWHRYWDKHSRHYDQSMQQMDRWVFGDSRQWACGQATGDVLEVAVGTGLNLPLYPEDAVLTGIDLSEEMLAQARDRAASLGRDAVLSQADAHALPFDDGAFDTVVCTFGLCAIPDVDRAVAEMHRVLRPGGRLILVDHVVSTSPLARGVQRALEIVSIPVGGEHFRRRPHDNVVAAGFAVQKADRFKIGVVERLVARKPG